MISGANLSRIKKKILPPDDGQDTLKLRTGVVSAVNANGTCDVTISGVTVAGVPRLQEASVAVGLVVQILTYRGSMIIIGRAATGGQTPGLGLWARGQATSSGTIPTTTTVGSFSQLLVTNTVTFVANRVYECKTHGGVQSTATGYADLRAFRAGPATQIGEFFRFPITSTGVAMNGTGGGLYFTPAASVSGAVALYGGVSAGTGSHVGTGGTPRNIEVYDVGDISQYSGITTW